MADLKKFLPKAYKKRRYYNLSELAQHNHPNDLWVAFFHEIYDLTKLIQQNIHRTIMLDVVAEVRPLVEAAGTDITNWFDQKTKEPRKFVAPNGEEEYYCPQGRYLDLPKPNIEQDHFLIPWWKNQEYYVGKLTKCSRNIKIVNTLAKTEDVLEVPSEETIDEILNRYEEINFHASSYTWKRNGKPLVMNKTLEENGIVDERKTYEELEVPEEEWYVPSVHLYFNDDLSVK